MYANICTNGVALSYDPVLRQNTAQEIKNNNLNGVTIWSYAKSIDTIIYFVYGIRILYVDTTIIREYDNFVLHGMEYDVRYNHLTHYNRGKPNVLPTPIIQMLKKYRNYNTKFAPYANMNLVVI